MFASVLSDAAAILAASIGLSFLVFITWAGWLYHRVLSLPPGQRKHGQHVLSQLTRLLRAWPRPGK